MGCLSIIRKQGRCLALTAMLACGLTGHPVSADSSGLPTLGGVGGGLVSEQQEAAIGERVLQSIRRSDRLVQDPLVRDYLSDIVHNLVPYAPLTDRDLHLVVVDSAGINAFAVPGGIIGVNGGLFLNAKTEQQFASVIAHEIAHLSQRHFARRMQQQETSAPMTVAGMLAGIILSAVTQSDVGIAAIAGSQAMAVQNMLQYSRAHEKEADRVGLDILAQAGMDPKGMPRMFEIMMDRNRLQGGQPPEYLSTHPLTPSRVSDTWNRAQQYPERDVSDSLEYHLMRARLQVRYARSDKAALNAFGALVRDDDASPAARYGLAVAHLANNQPGEAEPILRRLLDQSSGRITFTVTLAKALQRQGQYDEAREQLEAALRRNPENDPITLQLADVELAAGNASVAAKYYAEVNRRHPDNAHLWQKRAEAEGQARNIVSVHRARAEFHQLTGDLEAAERQLMEALGKVPGGSPVQDVIQQRLTSVRERLTRQRQF
ncbi:putative Zn-dependent protease [Tamilnaduibacter salinus]|uniref:Putative beta-barrel assembly-enhancing protease n=1 Tax=Tamilnaduibacter salinus TaxID=1484056 RepID=A0A2U1CZX9_9GAMM|nr:putative Zn-dependent protease [Tamilnaduibacter salinus]